MEEADYKSTTELFGKRGDEKTLDNFIPKSESDFLEYAQLISHKIRPYDVCSASSSPCMLYLFGQERFQAGALLALFALLDASEKLPLLGSAQGSHETVDDQHEGSWR